jgi:hypothetical protein
MATVRPSLTCRSTLRVIAAGSLMAGGRELMPVLSMVTGGSLPLVDGRPDSEARKSVAGVTGVTVLR